MGIILFIGLIGMLIGGGLIWGGVLLLNKDTRTSTVFGFLLIICGVILVCISFPWFISVINYKG